MSIDASIFFFCLRLVSVCSFPLSLSITSFRSPPPFFSFFSCFLHHIKSIDILPLSAFYPLSSHFLSILPFFCCCCCIFLYFINFFSVFMFFLIWQTGMLHFYKTRTQSLSLPHSRSLVGCSIQKVPCRIFILSPVQFAPCMQEIVMISLSSPNTRCPKLDICFGFPPSQLCAFLWRHRFASCLMWAVFAELQDSASPSRSARVLLSSLSSFS